MNAVKLTVASVLLVGLPSLAPAADTDTQAKSTAEIPDASWVVVEDAWLYPLRLDSVEALDEASFHYRRNEERAAARKIREAVSWLDYAAHHAEPITKGKLDTAQTELRTLADDLSTGKVVGAARMGAALAHASQGLAEWHYYRAKEQFGKNEALLASQDLEAAAAHLQRAADSAHYQFGPDTVTVFDDIVKDGKLIENGRTLSHNQLGTRLDKIESAVKEMADALA